MLCMMVTNITKHDKGVTSVTVTVTLSHNIKKNIKGSRIDNII